MGQILLALCSAMLGGILVLSGDVAVRRSEERHRWSEQLQKTTADLLGTYGAARSALIGARMRGEALPGEEKMEYVERNRIYSHFSCTPGCEPMIGAVEEVTEAVAQLRGAFGADDLTWKLRNEDAKIALVNAQATLRQHVQDQTSLVSWKPRRARIGPRY